MSFQNISVKKQDIDFYRGDSTRLVFSNISEYDSGQTVKFSVKKSPDSSLVISKDITTENTEGNDWTAFIIAVNLTDGDTQLLPEGIYRYDLQVIRAGIVKTEYYGIFNLIGDITRVGQGVISTVTEADIYANLASNESALGASLVGVSTSLWGSILTLANRTVQKALEWLLNNKLTIPSSYTANRLIKLGTSPNTTQTGISVSATDEVTGAKLVTATDAPSDDSHLTRKDYVDAIVEIFLDSLGGTTDQFLKKDSAGYSFDTPPSADVEAYLDSLGGTVDDVLTKDSSGYSFQTPAAADVEAFLDSLAGSNDQFLKKDSSGYFFANVPNEINSDRFSVDPTTGQIESSIASTVGSSYVAKYLAYMARVWCNFDGTGTPSIRGSGNVSTITDHGTGDYEANYSAALPDNIYGVSIHGSDDANNRSCPGEIVSRSVGSIRFNTKYNPTATNVDMPEIHLVVYR